MAPQNQSKHNRESSYREMLIEHLFIGNLLCALWPRHAEVMKPQVDDRGYDLVIEACGITRHIQLKTSMQGAKTSRQNVQRRLREKPSGCVVWIWFDHNFYLGPFLWFGGRPGDPLPCLSGFKTARHSKADSTGKKRERPEHRVVGKGRFEKLNDITQVVERLFGHR